MSAQTSLAESDSHLPSVLTLAANPSKALTMSHCWQYLASASMSLASKSLPAASTPLSHFSSFLRQR